MKQLNNANAVIVREKEHAPQTPDETAPLVLVNPRAASRGRKGCDC